MPFTLKEMYIKQIFQIVYDLTADEDEQFMEVLPNIISEVKKMKNASSGAKENNKLTFIETIPDYISASNFDTKSESWTEEALEKVYNTLNKELRKKHLKAIYIEQIFKAIYDVSNLDNTNEVKEIKKIINDAGLDADTFYGIFEVLSELPGEKSKSTFIDNLPNFVIRSDFDKSNDKPSDKLWALKNLENIHKELNENINVQWGKLFDLLPTNDENVINENIIKSVVDDIKRIKSTPVISEGLQLYLNDNDNGMSRRDFLNIPFSKDLTLDHVNELISLYKMKDVCIKQIFEIVDETNASITDIFAEIFGLSDKTNEWKDMLIQYFYENRNEWTIEKIIECKNTLIQKTTTNLLENLFIILSLDNELNESSKMCTQVLQAIIEFMANIAYESILEVDNCIMSPKIAEKNAELVQNRIIKTASASFDKYEQEPETSDTIDFEAFKDFLQNSNIRSLRKLIDHYNKQENKDCINKINGEFNSSDSFPEDLKISLQNSRPILTIEVYN